MEKASVTGCSTRFANMVASNCSAGENESITAGHAGYYAALAHDVRPLVEALEECSGNKHLLPNSTTCALCSIGRSLATTMRTGIEPTRGS